MFAASELLRDDRRLSSDIPRPPRLYQMRRHGHGRSPLPNIPNVQAARSTRWSISLRSVAKSIGLVRSASAPFSSALRFVSASP